MDAAGTCLALWVYGRVTDRLKVVSGERYRIPAAHLYPAMVRADLAMTDVHQPAGLTAESLPEQWEAAHQGFNGRVLGVMLCKPFWAPTAMTYMNQRQLLLRDFYQHYGVRTLAVVEIIRVVSLAQPVQVYQQRAGLRPTERSLASQALRLHLCRGSHRSCHIGSLGERVSNTPRPASSITAIMCSSRASRCALQCWSLDVVLFPFL